MRISDKNRILIIKILLGLLIISFTMGTLIRYAIGLSGSHIILTFITISFIVFSRKKEDTIINRYMLPIVSYVILVLIGTVSFDSDIIFILQAGMYRIMFPLLILILISDIQIIKNIHEISSGLIRVTFLACSIIAMFALIERIRPEFIYNLYIDGVTPHRSLKLNGQTVVRLLSVVRNPINLGLYMCIGFFSGISLFIESSIKKIGGIVLIICMAVFVYIMFYTYSRSVLLMLIVSLSLLVLFMIPKNKLKNMIILFFIIGIIVFTIVNVYKDSNYFFRRISTINFNSFIDNVRLQRTIEAFKVETTLGQLVFGHGIYKVNNSSAFLFEMGYGSLMFESGILGMLLVVGVYLYNLVINTYVFFQRKVPKNLISHSIFYYGILISGLVGLLVQDLYMQLPYSFYLWYSVGFFSTIKQSKM